jgi:hypothetical protein
MPRSLSWSQWSIARPNRTKFDLLNTRVQQRRSSPNRVVKSLAAIRTSIRLFSNSKPTRSVLLNVVGETADFHSLGHDAVSLENIKEAGHLL